MNSINALRMKKMIGNHLNRLYKGVGIVDNGRL